ncbi:MAG: hypothetical protein ABWX68_07115 [Arthrobacter sp.]|uniref:hypothetical protein n=1 Tax=Arthrobacter sp. TaxID=1667 RepID=UPI003475733A
MRLRDDPAALRADPAFACLGSPAQVEARMRRTWLHHADFLRILAGEFEAGQTYRVRYAVSGDASRWSTAVEGWPAPG